MYLCGVKFTKSYRCFSKCDQFELKPATLLVGGQGCGKSTLLSLLQRNDSVLSIELTPLGESGVESFYFDAEGMNPRTRDPQYYADIGGKNVGIGYGSALQSRFLSHGEVLEKFTVDALQKAADCVILLDEPETALSLRNQFRLARELKLAIDRQCQFIVATHSLILVESFPQVLSLEDRKWVDSTQFINMQRTP